MKKLPSLVLLFVLSITAFSQVITPFAIRKTITQKGGIVFLSNVSTKATPDNVAQNQIPPSGTGTDNDFLNTYVDIDSDPTTWMSSSDQLNLPSCSEISWAGLYWGGDNSTGDENYATRNQVKLKAGSSAYIDLTADYLKDNTTGYKSYHCFKNITSILQANSLTTNYTIANVATDVNGKNLFGGWTIVVVYKNSLQPMRNLTVFDGLSFVGGAGAIVDIPISGFQTPLSGPVTFELGLVVYDGDRSYVGDQLLFKGASSFVNVLDAIHPVNDVFNSTLAKNGALTSLRNPSYNNTLGYDATIFSPNNTTKNYIGNNAISATIRQTTGGEYFITQVVTSAIDVYEPDLRAATRVKNLTHPGTATAERGDILEYTITGLNIGSDPSINTYIKDTIEGNAEFVPGSIKVLHGTNPGVKTDGLGDDEAEYLASSKVVKVRIGTGASSSIGGKVINDPAGTDSTQFSFQVKVSSDCVYLSCDNVIDNSSYIVGTGEVSGNTFDNGSNPEIFNAFGCPKSGATKTPITTTGCGFVGGTATSPICQGDNINLTLSGSPSATYLWTGPNGFTSTLQNPTITNATVANAGTYVGHIKINKTTCDMKYYPTVAVTAALAGADQVGSTTCGVNTTTLAANSIAGGGAWSIQSGAGGSFSDINSPTSNFSGTTGVLYTLRWTATGGSCPSTFDEVNVRFNQAATSAVLSGNSSICYNGYANLKVNITGGTSPYTVTLNNGGGTFTNYISGNDIIVGPLTATKTFNIVSVTDANGCNASGISGSATITVSDAITGTGIITQLNPPVSGGGPKPAGTAATAIGTAWTGYTNTTSSNNVCAQVSLSSNTNSAYMYLSNFGFTVPAGATINGVEVAIERFYTTTGTRAISSGSMRLGTVTGTSWSSLSTSSQTLAAFPLNSKATQTVGGPTNLLATTTLTPTIVNASNFGVRIRATSTGTSGTATANIDFVTVKIYYTPAAAYCDDATSIGFSVTPYTNATTYTWSSITGGTVVTGQGTSSCTMDFNGAGQSGNYNVCVTASNNCQSLAPSCITIPVSDCVNSSLYIMGNVYWDKNGSAAASGKVDGTGVGSTTVNGVTTPLYVTLMAASPATTALQNSVLVKSDGTYKFLVSASTAYQVVLSKNSYTTGQAVTAALPAGCSYTGEKDNDLTNSLTGDDGTDDGKIAVAGFTTNNNINVNFGIKISTPPVAVNDITSTNEDTPVSYNVTSNDTDADGTVTVSTVDLDPLTPSVQNSLTNASGSWSVDLSGVVTYTPTANFNGNASITYTVNDNDANTSNIGTLFITITAVNDAPITVNDAITTLEDTPVSINVTTNDTDVDGTVDVSTVDLDPSTAGIQTTFTVVNQGTYTVNASGVVTFTPVSNFNGAATPISYRVNDNSGATSASATLTITVTSVIDSPIADNDTPSTDQNVPVSFSVTTNDIGVDAPINVATVDLDPYTAGIQTSFTVIGEGNYTVSALGVVTFTPDVAFYGTTTPIEYVVNDNSGNTSNSATITIFVTAANAPVANNDIMPNANEGSFITFDVTANDVAATGHTLNVSRIDLDPSTAGIQQSFDILGEGTFSVDMMGIVTFAPAWGFYGGPVTASYTIKDNLGLISNIATISVTVIHVNQRPTTGDDFVTTNEDTPITFNVTTNDVDDNGLNVATVDLNPSLAGRQTTFSVSGEGTYTVDNLGNVTFTPVSNFNGVATPIYYVIDDNGIPLPVLTSDGDLPGMISVTVNSVNDAPVAVNDTRTAPSFVDVVFSIISNDTDADGAIDPTTVDLNPSFPGIQNSFTVTGEGTYTVDNTGVLTFDALPAFIGPITATAINYTVNDNQGTTSNIATITITLTSPNVPTANDDAASTNEDVTVVIPDITSNDTQGSGTSFDLLTIDLNLTLVGVQTSSTNAFGTWTVNTSTGQVTYIPTGNYFGTATINYVVNDDLSSTSNPATITVVVSPVNDLPTASNKTVTTNEDVDFGFGFTDFGYSDIDSDPMALLQISTLPAKGTLYLDYNGDGVLDVGESISALGTISKADIDAGYLRYKPLANENGSPYTTFTFKVNDGTAYSTSAYTVTINLTAVNDAPVAVANSTSTDENTPITINVVSDDTDVDGTINVATVDLDPFTIGIQSSFTSTNGVWTVSALGIVTFTPNSNYSGTEAISYVVNDNSGATSNSANISVTVNPMPLVTLSVDNATIIENSEVATFTAKLNHISGKDVTVNLGFAGTAAGTDYTQSASSITILAGSTTGTITVTAVQDLILEANETVIVSITSVTNGLEDGAQAETTTITDDDSATAALSVTQHGSEAGPVSIVYTVTLSKTNNTGLPITFEFDDLGTGTAISGSDYTAIAGAAQISVANGSSTGTINVDVTDDALFEATETVIAGINTPSMASVTISTPSATANIADNETATAALSVTQHGSEAGPVNIIYTVTLSKTNNTGSAITFDIDQTGGTATSGSDYTAFGASDKITVANGASTGTYSVAVTDDALLEAAETVQATISGSSNASVTVSTAVATANITDNETATAALSVTQHGSEAGPVNIIYTVTLSKTNNTGSAITFDIDQTGGTATSGSDYTAFGASDKISVANGASTGTYSVAVTDDALLEATETVQATISGSSNASVTVSTAVATANITDNETATAALSVTQHGSEAGPVNIIYTVTLSKTNNTGSAITFDIDQTGGTATSGSDYTAFGASDKITVANGASTGTYSVAVTDDALLEATETVQATISGSSNASVTVSTASATANITDNETATAALSVTQHGSEAGPVNIIYTVTLSKTNNTGSAITFDIDQTGGTATSGSDYTAFGASDKISVANGASTGTYSVVVTDDALLEAAETVQATISGSSNASVTVSTAVATANITDNETATAALSVTQHGSEAGPVNIIYTVTLSKTNNTGSAITFDIDQTGGTATSGSDYTAFGASDKITVANGASTGTYSVAVTDDALLEAIETVQATISGSSNASVTVSTAVATANITDNETATAALSVTQHGSEAGPVNIIYTVTLSKTNNTGSAITFEFDDLGTGTATSGADYTAIAGATQVSVANGASTGTISVTVINDAIYEITETVIAGINTPSNANVTITTASASANITDNDTESDLSITKTVNNSNPNVGSNVVFTLTVTNNGPSDATSVIATDILPTGYVYVSNSPSVGTYNSGSGNWTIGNLANGAIATLDITATVKASGVYLNTASVVGAETDPNGTDDSDDAIVTPVAISNLSIVKSVDNSTPKVGDNVVFTLTVTNNGPSDATGVTATDALPSGYTYVSDNVSGDYNSGTGVWTIGNLANGASVSLDITAKVNASGSYANTATVSSPVADPTPGNNASTSTPVPVPQSNLSIAKSVDNATPNVGSNVMFTLTVTNNGPSDATSISAADALPSGYTYVSDNGTGAYNSGTGAWTIGNLANGASASLDITAKVNASGSYANTATVTSPVADPTPGNNTSTSTPVPVPQSNLSITKSVDNATPNVGSNVVFTITVTNNGPSDATSISASDALPSGYSYVSDNGSGAYDNGTGVWTIGNLANGASATLDITAKVNASGSYANTATVSSPVADPTPGNNTSTSTPVPVPQSNLSIIKSVDNATPNVGSNVVFTLTVTNNGPSDATGVTATDALPSGYTYVSDNGAGAYDNGTGVWTIGNLANGASATLDITAKVNASGSYANTATVSSPVADPTPGNNTSTSTPVPVPQSNLSITKSVSNGTPIIGSNIVFTLTATNHGPSDATGVKVTDILPSGFTYVSDDGSGAYNSGTGLWTVGTLANGATATLNMTVTVNATGSYINTASITGDQADPNSGNNSDTSTPTPGAQSNLSIAKTVDNPTPNVGSNVVFTISITNNGPNAATGVEVTDLLPSGYTYVSDNTTGEYNSSTGLWSVGNMNNGITKSIEITAKVNASGNYTNSASVTADQPDPSTGNNTSSVSTIPVAQSNLTIVKSVNTSTPNVGSNVVFTLTVTNNGPSDASGVKATDALPSGYTYVSDNGSGAYNSGSGLWTIGNLANGATVTLNITARVNASGNYTNTATVTGEQQDPNTGDETSSVTTTPNFVPVATDDNSSTNQDTPVTINVLNNDTGLNDGPITVTITVNPTQGTFVVNADNTITYTPNAGFTGTDIFTYKVCDSNGDCATAIVTVTVNSTGTDHLPVAVDDNAETEKDKEVVISVLANDSGLEDGGLVVTIINQPTHGTVVINADNTITYIPEDGYAGEDSFSYQVCDADGDCSTAIVNITIENTIIIPDGFSPNGDGINDNYVIPGLENYKRVSIDILNRWGSVVYSSSNYKNNWDGTANTGLLSGQVLPTGTYFYVLHIHDNGKKATGYVYLNK